VGEIKSGSGFMAFNRGRRMEHHRKESDRFVGTCGFWKGKDWPTELTWWLLPSARGKGYAVEASKVAIQYAFNHLKWKTVETYMNDDNIAARNLTVKLGGVKTRRSMFPDGQERDVFSFARQV